LTIPFADAPDRGRILFDFLAQSHNALLFIASAQQDLCATGNFQWRVAVPQ